MNRSDAHETKFRSQEEVEDAISTLLRSSIPTQKCSVQMPLESDKFSRNFHNSYEMFSKKFLSEGRSTA